MVLLTCSRATSLASEPSSSTTRPRAGPGTIVIFCWVRAFSAGEITLGRHNLIMGLAATKWCNR